MLTTKRIKHLITRFKGTTFHEAYRAEDWLLTELMAIKKEEEEYVKNNKLDI